MVKHEIAAAPHIKQSLICAAVCVHNKFSSVKKACGVVLREVVVLVGLGQRVTSGVF